MSTAAIILAAGKGTRMKSDLPKVLHPVAGWPLIAHAVHWVAQAKLGPVVIVVSPNNHGAIAEAIQNHLHTHSYRQSPDIRFAIQTQQRGTGDAAAAGLTQLKRGEAKHALIMCGDTPLLQPATLRRLTQTARKTPVAFLSAEVPNPAGYGRVLRTGSTASGIVEHKDASTEQQRIQEINVGTYMCELSHLRKVLKMMDTNNAQGEYYLTDLVNKAKGQARPVLLGDPREGEGINTRQQLHTIEHYFQAMRKQALIESGVNLRLPDTIWIDAGVSIGKDVTIGPHTQLLGNTTIAKNVFIEGSVLIRNCSIKEGARIHAFSHLEQASVGKKASVGPYARLRPAAVLDAESKVGNFVEVKKSHVGKGAKLNHLSYVGDATVGKGANVGAGTITCNYDGYNKHHTDIGDGVFVGSNSTLVAPVKLGKGTFVAAGSTITEDTPNDSLTFGRARQKTKAGYAKALRKRLKPDSK